MGNPGRRRRSGQHRWLRALISRGRPSEEAASGLLAEPAEFGWPSHSDTERPAGDAADDRRADPAAYQWLGGWTDQAAPRRLLDGLPESGWPAEPGASARFAGHGTGPGLHGRRRAGRAGWLGQVTQQDWYLALAPVPLVRGGQPAGGQPEPGCERSSGRHPGRQHTGRQHTGAGPVRDAAGGYPGQLRTWVRDRHVPAGPAVVRRHHRPVHDHQREQRGAVRLAVHRDVPGDQVQFVIGAADPDLGSDVLVLAPASAGAQLAPGGRTSAVFFAAGQTASPAACSFNGTAG